MDENILDMYKQSYCQNLSKHPENKDSVSYYGKTWFDIWILKLLPEAYSIQECKILMRK